MREEQETVLCLGSDKAFGTASYDTVINKLGNIKVVFIFPTLVVHWVSVSEPVTLR